MEAADIGLHCSMEECQQQDFLPFKCDACTKVFCLEHRTFTAHSCTVGKSRDKVVPQCPLCGTPVPSPDPDGADEAVNDHIKMGCPKYKRNRPNRCSLPSCNNTELVPVGCASCKHNFCFKHRHEGDHNCESLVAQKESIEKRQQAKRARPVVDTTKNLKKNSAMAKKVRLMKMKASAKGDPSLPMEKRFFVELHQPREMAKPPSGLYFNGTFSVAKVLDIAASAVGIVNNNNKADARLLRLYDGETGELLDNNKKLSEMENGMAILLEYTDAVDGGE